MTGLEQVVTGARACGYRWYDDGKAARAGGVIVAECDCKEGMVAEMVERTLWMRTELGTSGKRVVGMDVRM